MVTTEDLKDLVFLSMEIDDINRNLRNLKNLLPPSISHSQRAECAAALTELKGLLIKRRDDCTDQLKTLNAFMDSISDDFVRDLFQMRYQERLTWKQISMEVRKRHGLRYEPDSLKVICSRYLRRCNNAGTENEKENRTAAAL